MIALKPIIKVPSMLRQNQLIFLLFTFCVTISCKNESTWKWFPHNPNDPESFDTSNITENNWKGKWFPEAPTVHKSNDGSYERDRIMGIPNSECDDGETKLSTDFDPNNYEHSLMFTCLEKIYKPNYDIEPIETIYDVPKFYTPVHKCMNETISYDQRIPTLGYHRPLWAAYGEYIFLPPQRWLHNLEHGAIVALYHPCANKQHVNQLKTIVKNCLYRHIITPSRELSPERPLALAGWGVSLEFSVINRPTLLEFIRKYAKAGPEKVSRDGQYKKFLTESSKIITDVDDSIVCP